MRLCWMGRGCRVGKRAGVRLVAVGFVSYVIIRMKAFETLSVAMHGIYHRVLRYFCVSEMRVNSISTSWF